MACTTGARGGVVAWCSSLPHQLGVVGYLGFDSTFQKRRNLRRERGSEPTGAVGLEGRQLRVGPAHACMGVPASKTLMHKKSRILPMCVLQKTSKSKQPASRRIGWSRLELEFLNHSTQARRQVPFPLTRGWMTRHANVDFSQRPCGLPHHTDAAIDGADAACGGSVLSYLRAVTSTPTITRHNMARKKPVFLESQQSAGDVDPGRQFDGRPSQKQSESVPASKEDAIRRTAYAIYEERNGADGSAEDDWLAAEARIARIASAGV